MNCNLGRPWTATDDAWLRAFAADNPVDVLAVQLDRSQAAVFHRTRRLGLFKRRRWTERDDKRLRMLWGLPLAEVARQLGRTTLTTYWRAQRLGLGLGVPQGGEYLSAAARRCGYVTSQLRRILGWAGVQIHRSITRFKHRRTFHWVIPDDVDAAVAKWHETETPNAASRARGVSLSRLMGRLLACGLPLPRRPGGKRHWRIPSATIDRALATVERRGKCLVLKEAA